LISVAHALRTEVRDSDLAIRWRGDELLVVSRSFDRRFAGVSADRLRHPVGSLTLRVGGDELRCTLSIGYAAFPFLPHAPRALTWEQTLEIADRALLLTKRRRRDGSTGLVAGP